MKIAVIGGAGVRVPLLVNGLASAALGIDEFALYDPDQERLAVIAGLARRRSGAARVTTHASSAPAIDGASFVVTSIRAGGMEARIRDERAALDLGFVGQETVGPGGFAMAVRTIPPLLDYARQVMQRAPDAWIINFTNPAGLVTQALTSETGARVVGICDTPTEVFQEVAHALGVPAEECRFDYVGLNHLGFIREVYWRGKPQLHALWENERGVGRGLPDAAFLAGTAARAAPAAHRVRVLLRVAGARDRQPARCGRHARCGHRAPHRELFADLAKGDPDPVARYERYLADRSAGYMQFESGAQGGPAAPAPWAAPHRLRQDRARHHPGDGARHRTR